MGAPSGAMRVAVNERLASNVQPFQRVECAQVVPSHYVIEFRVARRVSSRALFSIRHPLQQVARLYRERSAQAVERIGREPPELHVRIGQAIGGGDGESRFLGQTVRCPSSLLQNGIEMKANHGHTGERQINNAICNYRTND